MKTEAFDYTLPSGMIAQRPERERSSSRLLVLNRRDGRIEHVAFREIVGFLRQDDLLVVNNTRVIPARLAATKETGGSVDLLLVEKIDERRWSCLATGVKKGAAEASVSVNGTALRLRAGSPAWTVEFPDNLDVDAFLARHGKMPLPHYIKRPKSIPVAECNDADRYQTVYASEEGSIAAPTAGLHFDEDLLADIREMGVAVAEITLHVGVGTFFLIKSAEIEGHEMQRERYSVPPDALEKVRETKSRGGRVIAVGTTTVRTLETVGTSGNGTPLSGSTDLFIYPGYKFRVVDALITNFHIPRSTPLLLACAFAGKETIEAAYREAIDHGYRFYSYGDAMFIS